MKLRFKHRAFQTAAVEVVADCFAGQPRVPGVQYKVDPGGVESEKQQSLLDDFQSHKPIDVIKANRPILILDEPQKMEGKKTLRSLEEFKPHFILRYSATHKTQRNTERALQIASRLALLQPIPPHQRLLALTQPATGRSDEAVETQKQTVAIAPWPVPPQEQAQMQAVRA